jgi:hypothetical protein
MESIMNANLGNLDRVIRIILGLALIAAPLLNIPAVWSSAVLSYGSMAVGLVLVVTGLFRFCPLYRIFGISTCKL